MKKIATILMFSFIFLGAGNASAQTFTMPVNPVTTSVTGVFPTTALFQAKFNLYYIMSMNIQTSFIYGLEGNLNQTIPATSNSGGYSAAISNLTPGKTYSVQAKVSTCPIVGIGPCQEYFGNIVTFTTPGLIDCVPGPYHFFRPLYYGLTNDADVRILQAFLNEHGYLEHAVTGNFYSLTRAAVVRFQIEHGLPGTGYVGPLTRALLNTFSNSCPTPVY